MEFNSHLDYGEYKRKRTIPNKNTLKKYITTGKDILETASHHDVVYRISCNDCDASYIGQTKRQLKTRNLQSIRQISIKKSGFPSVISNHRILIITLIRTRLKF